jgi:glycosyltransferase involved in cell wall biosynthesis
MTTFSAHGTSGVRRPRLFLMTDALRTGGTERQFALMARALESGPFEIRLGCLQRAGAFLDQVGEIEEFNPRGSFLSRAGLTAFLRLARHMRAQRIAVAHSFDYYSNLLMIPAARWAGVPVVIGSLRNLGDRRTLLQWGALLGVFGLCSRVVCNSRAAAERLVAGGLAETKICVIQNGLPAEAFNAREPALPGLPGVLRVGMIARMNEAVKNHPLFLRACARVAAEFPSLEVLLVGDGPLRGDLERLAGKLGLGERARFLGERHDIPAILASLDVSVVTSQSESLSNVILESMAAGKPVVASRVGGNPELVRDGETGRLFELSDEDAFVDALREVLRKPERMREMGERARRAARERFHIDTVRKQFESLYTDALEQVRSARGRMPIPTAGGGKLRVALVAPSLRTVGGQSVQADLLLRCWRATPGVQAQLIPTNPDFPPGLRWVEAIPFLRSVVRLPVYLASLWRGLSEADVAHIFSASYWSFLLAPAPALWMAHRLGRKALINYRSGEARDHLKNWRTALPVLRRADRLVVPSGYLRDVFGEYGLEAEVISNIVDLDQFNYRERRPVQPRFVCTRGFEPYYSVDLVVRAFAEVRREFSGARLCLVGNGSLEAAVREQVRALSLESSVEFAGLVKRNEIGGYYDRADIFLNASWLDNMPGSVLEAFAAGTPVVSTAPEGIRYIVEHEKTGLLCEPGDWQALARNALRVLREPELGPRLARNAHAASQACRWEAVRDAWLAVYRELAEEGGIAHPVESAESHGAGK